MGKSHTGRLQERIFVSNFCQSSNNLSSFLLVLCSFLWVLCRRQSFFLLPDLFTSNSSVSRNTLQLEHQLELLAPDMIMELSARRGRKTKATGYRGGPGK